MKNYITVKELASKLNISVTAIYKKIYAGEIKSTKIGRMHLISASDIDKIQVRRKKRHQIKSSVKKAVSRVVKEHLEAFQMLGED